MLGFEGLKHVAPFVFAWRDGLFFVGAFCVALLWSPLPVNGPRGWWHIFGVCGAFVLIVPYERLLFLVVSPRCDRMEHDKALFLVFVLTGLPRARAHVRYHAEEFL